MLAKAVRESQRDWDEWLAFVMAAYRASPHESTGCSQNHFFLARETRVPLDLIVMGLPVDDRKRCAHQYVADMKGVYYFYPHKSM